MYKTKVDSKEKETNPNKGKERNEMDNFLCLHILVFLLHNYSFAFSYFLLSNCIPFQDNLLFKLSSLCSFPSISYHILSLFHPFLLASSCSTHITVYKMVSFFSSRVSLIRIMFPRNTQFLPRD